jgi:hypothetical protein
MTRYKIYMYINVYNILAPSEHIYIYDSNVSLLDFVCPTLTQGATVYFYKKMCMNPMMSFSECALCLFLLCVKYISPADDDAHRHVTFGTACIS